MSGIWCIAKREFKGYFQSPFAYVLLGLFGLFSGVFFVILLDHFDQTLQRAQFQLAQNPDILARVNLNEMVMGQMVFMIFWILMIFIPLTTMRTIAEEKAQGTFELLFTSPISTWDIVLGKAAAAVGFLFTLLSTHVIILYVIFGFGNPEVWPIVSIYLGLVLFGISLISIGIFASSLTRYQFLAAIIAATISLSIVLIGVLSRMAPGNLREFFEKMAFQSNFDGFSQGLISVSAVTYFVTLSLLFLSATRISLESLTRR
jgi:ABC-2 type transport system permease protein